MHFKFHREKTSSTDLGFYNFHVLIFMGAWPYLAITQECNLNYFLAGANFHRWLPIRENCEYKIQKLSTYCARTWCIDQFTNLVFCPLLPLRCCSSKDPGS